MESKRNALAYLADWLEEQEDSFPVLCNLYTWQDKLDRENIKKIRRIVAELAKVEDVDTLHNLEYVRVPNSYQCYDAIVKCREIAEEGAEDGE